MDSSPPWDFPGKNTGMGCHFLLQGIFLTQELNLHLLHCRQILYHWATEEALSPLCVHALSLLSCLTLCDPINFSLSGSSVHGILQQELEWVAMTSSGGSSQPRGQTCVSCSSLIAGRFYTTEPKSPLGLNYFSPVFRPCFLWQLGMAFPTILPEPWLNPQIEI